MSDIQDDAPLLDVETFRTQLEATKLAQAGSDRKYQDTAKRLKEVEKENADLLTRVAHEKDIIGRLNKIYSAFEEKEQQREIEFYARVRCLDGGIPFKLVQNEKFPDRESVDTRLSVIQETLEEIKVSGINEVLSSASKPKGGESREDGGPLGAFKNMSMDALGELFRTGRL